MAFSQTPVSDREPSSKSKVKVQRRSNKADEKCLNLPEGHTSSLPPAPAPEEKKKKRNECPGVRVVGGRIYDSQNGKTCHQCRQKTMDIMAPCKNHKNGKQCSAKFCHKCILNRYGEKAEEVAVLEEWLCPKCRGICNCSFCRKKSGQQPTGILAHTAKSTGFSSVSEMLLVNGSDYQPVKEVPNLMVFTPLCCSFLISEMFYFGYICFQESAHVIKRKKGKENILSKNSDLNPNVENAKKVKGRNVMDHGAIISKKRKRKSNKDKEGINEDVPDAKKLDSHCGKSKITMQSGQIETNSISFFSDVEIPLPQGTELRTVVNIELQSEEVGPALQFLEFCAAFEEILELKKDEPEYILHELIRGGGGCIGRSSPVAQFLVRLLLLIQTDSGESSPVITHRLRHKTSWLLALHKCISSSTFPSGNLKLDKFDGGVDSYGSLNSTERLTLVNFVCDEVLCTNKVRNWIDEQNLKFTEKVKEIKQKVVAAKQKEKQLKQKMKDELAEVLIAKNGAPLSISEHTTIVSKFKVETAQAHAEMLESKVMLCSEKQDCISARTKPILIDNDGRTFWRLKGCGDESNILLQETSHPDASVLREKWFAYEEEQIENVKKYISFKEKRSSYRMAAGRHNKI